MIPTIAGWNGEIPEEYDLKIYAIFLARFGKPSAHILYDHLVAREGNINIERLHDNEEIIKPLQEIFINILKIRI